MSETSNLGPKKSVALSGVTAGNTALCTVGRTGNDLHYRGYDILEIATVCEFEEIAYLLIHEKLPNRAELTEYKARLRSLRGLPATVRGARHIADTLIASIGSMLVYWYHFSHAGQRIEVETEDDSIGGHFLHLQH